MFRVASTNEKGSAHEKWSIAEEARSSFLKKRSKRLLCRCRGSLRQRTRRKQKFFGSFFQKRTAFLPLWRPWRHPYRRWVRPPGRSRGLLAAGDRGHGIKAAEPGLVANIAAWFVRQKVRPGVRRVGGADRAVLLAMHGDALDAACSEALPKQ